MFVPETQFLVSLEKYNGYSEIYDKQIVNGYFPVIIFDGGFFFSPKAQAFEKKAQLQQ